MKDQALVAVRQSVHAVVPFQRPELPSVAAVDGYFAASRECGRFSNGGPCHELLAERLSAFTGGVAVPVANGTSGLMLALRAVTTDVPARRREVLLPSYTFAATGAAIAWTGLVPVHVDVDVDSWQVSAEALRAALRSRRGRVAAVVAASTFGTAPPVAVRHTWEDACQREGVPLVVDSASGFGSADETGAVLGLQGDAEVFSFHATKPLAIGEGGAVITRDEELAGRVRQLANFGFDQDRRLVACGLNAKLDEWSSATALAALDGLPEVLRARRANAKALRDRLDGLNLDWQPGSERSSHQFVSVLAPSGRARDRVLARAAQAKVELRTYFDPPLHRTSPFAPCPQAGPLAVTEDLAARCLSLPMMNDLSGPEADLIAAAVREGLGG